MKTIQKPWKGVQKINMILSPGFIDSMPLRMPFSRVLLQSQLCASMSLDHPEIKIAKGTLTSGAAIALKHFIASLGRGIHDTI
jgi:hypothetical protein